jgi:Carboxypeptidase regulatory-like domain/TonB dependent receptor
MQRHALAAHSHLRWAAHRSLPWLLFVALAWAAPAVAQSFLGTIRGTVTDEQGAVVSGATVLIIDEAAGATRTVDTDGEGRYEAAFMRPGTYRIEVVAKDFKKVEKPGVILRAAGTALVDVTLQLGGLAETVTVSAEPSNNITLDSQAIARGLDEQQLHDLPRNSRDMRDFLLLNPNIVGGFDDLQFLGSRTYGVTYIQDGQASTNAIFGTVGNSAPGLDAISEIQVLSNSYSAEYGGLAGVVVTSKRGSNAYHGTGFYDFNSDGLNALTYNQTLAGVERGDPLSDTHQHRWGVSVGGPLVNDRLFFYGNYEGSNDKAIYGGTRINVPTEAMRNGDFRGTAIVPNEPATGLPFADQVIPGNLIDPAARTIMDFFYPLPNQEPLANGYGVFQQFVPQTRNRHRGDIRLDHQATTNDTLFFRGSYQHRDPNSILFEVLGNGFTNFPIENTNLDTASAIGGWTKVLSPRIVNEFRVGYNYDNSRRESTFRAGDVSAQLGVETTPGLADLRGFPSFRFSGTNRPTDIRDQGRNVDRTLRQNAFSISDNFTWITGAHSLKTGGLWTRNTARDGFGIGLNHRGLYEFNGAQSGNAFTDFLLGLPRRVTEQVSNRGPLEGDSNDFALFVQDDWKVNASLTFFLGLRYEVVGNWHEKDDLLANFILDDGGHHVVPNAEVAAKLPPGIVALDRTLLASDVGLASTLIHTDRNNFSPRVGFAWRVDQSNKTVLRGGFGLFHPTVAVQGVRDLLATNEFRYGNTFRGSTLSHGFSTGTSSVDPNDYGSQGIDPNLKSPDIYQYNLTVERELPGDLGLRVSYIGSTMRNLLVTRFFNDLPASTVEFHNDFDNFPEEFERLPLYPPYLNTFTNITQNLGSGRFDAAQFQLVRRWRNGLAVDVAYTLAHSDSNAPDSGNSSLGVIQFDSYDIEKDRGPDPNVVKHRLVANATWDVPVGHGRKYGADLPGWANELFGGWTVSTIVQARSGPNLTPFFSGYYTTSPWNTGRALDGIGCFCESWRPDVVGDPNPGGSRDQWFNQAAYALPAPGTLGNAKRGSLRGPGTWVANFAFYKDIVTRNSFRLQFTTLLDNAFNHPQFFVGATDAPDFLNLSSFLNEGDANNGSTAVLGAGAVNNVEGFSPGRVIRLGIRATF